MKTTLRNDITVGNIIEGFVYSDDEANGLYGMNGMLTIQPEYQRCRPDGREAAVITSLLRGYPLGLFCFNTLRKGDSRRFEVLDGRRRLTAIGRFVSGCFEVPGEGGTAMRFSKFPVKTRRNILNTPLLICECDGRESELLEWIGNGGLSVETLNRQEIENLVFSGGFVARARQYFSNTSVAETRNWGCYLSGAADRQDFLAEALKWVSRRHDISTWRYLSLHRRDSGIDEIRECFDRVVDWVERTFITRRPEMRGPDWGRLYDLYHDVPHDPLRLENDICRLLADDHVMDRRGVFEYVLGGCADHRLPHIRLFDDDTMRYAYARQTAEAKCRGVSNCPLCAELAGDNRSRIWTREEMDADHVSVWLEKCWVVDVDDCRMLCREHCRAKGNR